MKFFYSLLFIMSLVNPLSAEQNIYQFSAKLINGESLNLSEYQGKVILIANTASNCGFTSQYGQLQELYTKYQDQGFVVLAFPSNDFGGQEPGSNEEIALFCDSKYNVTFPMFEKTIVKGAAKSDLFKFLTELSGPDLAGEIRWNFEKFIIDKNGQLVERYSSITGPNSSKITSLIEQLLKK